MPGKVRLEGDKLVLEVTGIDEILSLKRTIEVPLAHVADVSTEEVPWELFKQVRVAGTSLPYLVRDGTFITKEGLVFFEMHKPEKCVTIVLNDEKYKKIVFEVEDKERIADEIRRAIGQIRQKR